MTPRVNSTQPEWPFEPLEQPSDEGDITERGASEDLDALLTDFQRAALRWVASLD